MDERQYKATMRPNPMLNPRSATRSCGRRRSSSTAGCARICHVMGNANTMTGHTGPYRHDDILLTTAGCAYGSLTWPLWITVYPLHTIFPKRFGTSLLKRPCDRTLGAPGHRRADDHAVLLRGVHPDAAAHHRRPALAGPPAGYNRAWMALYSLSCCWHDPL